jgi:hypothetical protein
MLDMTVTVHAVMLHVLYSAEEPNPLRSQT